MLAMPLVKVGWDDVAPMTGATKWQPRNGAVAKAVRLEAPRSRGLQMLHFWVLVVAVALPHVMEPLDFPHPPPCHSPTPNESIQRVT